jgi:predicted MPP superfamily phosphohydrolase
MMGFVLVIYSLLIVAIDVWAVLTLRSRGMAMWAWLYGAFAVVTDVVIRIVPHFAYVYEQHPLAVIYCFYVYIIISLIKVGIAIGILLDRRFSRRRHLWRKTSAALSVLFVGFMLAGSIVPFCGVEVKRVDLQFSNLPEGFDGVRIGLCSDAHLGSLPAGAKQLQQMVDEFNSAGCLLVVNGGDLINIRNSELTDEYRQILQGIEAPVYSVIGNHDLGYYRRDTLDYPVAQSIAEFERAVDELGWTRLDDESRWVYNNGDSIIITGIRFHQEMADLRHTRGVQSAVVDSLMATVGDSAFNVVVSHIPQYWGVVCRTDAGDLTLSGHTHAMQLRMGDWSPASWMYDQWGGLYESGEHKLYISEGLGYAGIPFRLGTRPQITIITLRRCE